MNCKMPVPGNKWYHGGGLVDELIGVAVLFGYPIHSTSQSKIVWICKQIFPHLQAWLSFRTLWYDIVNFMYLVYSKQYRLWKEIEKKLIPPFPDTHRKPPTTTGQKNQNHTIDVFLHYNGGTQGAEAVHGFPDQPLPAILPGLELPVSGTDVMSHGVAKHVIHCVTFLFTRWTDPLD